MLTLPTVILKHTTRQGSHHDWLLASPHDPTGLLWTARMQWPIAMSDHRVQWMLEPIAPHRRVYLNYQGPISAGRDGAARGSVVRVARGTFAPIIWCTSRIVIDLDMAPFQARVEMIRLSARHWVAKSRASSRKQEMAVPQWPD